MSVKAQVIVSPISIDYVVIGYISVMMSGQANNRRSNDKEEYEIVKMNSASKSISM